MKSLSVPGWGTLQVKHVVLDLNGTVTQSGELIPGVLDRLRKFAAEGVDVYILSGDTRGTLARVFDQTSGITVVSTRNGEEKRAFVESIGADVTVCIGNGNIDVPMFKAARLAICTIQAEGATTTALYEADIVVTHVMDALDILCDPLKLTATLRG